MSVANQCPECHRDLAEDSPKGLCPACLMGMALCETPRGSDQFVSDETDAKVLNEVQDRFEVDISELPDEIDLSTYIEGR